MSNTKSLNFDEPRIMGILNVTPDSFSDGGLYSTPLQALSHFEELITDGAEIIDIGAESTRPNAKLINESDEWERLKPIFESIQKCNKKAVLSLDTRKAQIAKKALNYGISIINDVSGLDDPPMAKLIAANPDLKIVINHHFGLPASNEAYDEQQDILLELKNYFARKISYAKTEGIQEKQIILDPGLGFGKGLKHNLQILKNLDEIKKVFGMPILIGLSRKRFVRELWSEAQQDLGSVVLAGLALKNGASIVRCHEPKLHLPLKKVFKH